MEPELRQRLAANQDTFREINESIARGQWPGDEGAPVSFRCECARLGCNLLVELTLPGYERVRDHPRWFLVAHGHEVPEVESIVDSCENYLVVEKREEPSHEAERRDPRD